MFWEAIEIINQGIGGVVIDCYTSQLQDPLSVNLFAPTDDS